MEKFETKKEIKGEFKAVLRDDLRYCIVRDENKKEKFRFCLDSPYTSPYFYSISQQTTYPSVINEDVKSHVCRSEDCFLEFDYDIFREYCYRDYDIWNQFALILTKGNVIPISELISIEKNINTLRTKALYNFKQGKPIEKEIRDTYPVF